MPKPQRKILGPAARWLAVKRKERSPVKLNFSMKATQVLAQMLRSPETLAARVQGLQQWRAKDETGARQIIRLQHWLEKSVLKKVSEERYDAVEWAGELPGTYVDRLKEISRHYEAVGLADRFFSEGYYSLQDSLDGKAPAADLDELIDYHDPVALEGEKKP